MSLPPANAAVKASPEPSFLVICLCADWCGTCRDYRAGFDELATELPDARFRWVDIEDDADAIGDLDVENFPTLLIKHHGWIVFFGTMLPHLSHLRRMLESFGEQGVQEAKSYALSDAQRRSWQENADLVALAGDA